MLQTQQFEKTVHDLSIKKMSTDYFKVLFNALEKYGTHLKSQQPDNYFNAEAKDHSIVLELYFKLEPKVSKKELNKPLKKQQQQNKSFKLKVHHGIVVIDAIAHYYPDRDFFETPALEHLKEQITQQLL